MIYALIIIGLLLVSFAFILTEKNAKNMLAGYNSLSKEEKESVNIKNFIIFYKKFHLFLGISVIVLGLCFYFFISEILTGIFLGIYPIAAYIFFFLRTSKNFKDAKIGVVILIVILIGVSSIFMLGLRDNRLIISEQAITIKGMYGETLPKSEIKSIETVDSLPKIKIKTTGFALGQISKGYFKTENGEKIKLLLNSHRKPYILFTKKDDKKIYFSTRNKDNLLIYKNLKTQMPCKCLH